KTDWTDDHGAHSRTDPAEDDAYHGNTLGLPFALEKNEGDKAQRDHRTPNLSAAAASVSYRQLAGLIQSGRSGTIATGESFAFTDSGGSHVTGSSSLRITLRPPPIELLVEPADYAH